MMTSRRWIKKIIFFHNRITIILCRKNFSFFLLYLFFTIVFLYFVVVFLFCRYQIFLSFVILLFLHVVAIFQKCFRFFFEKKTINKQIQFCDCALIFCNLFCFFVLRLCRHVWQNCIANNALNVYKNHQTKIVVIIQKNCAALIA